MFSTNSSSRKPLLRTNSERPTMRNWPLFIFLFCLVFFFYAVYVYQAQSTELSYCRDQVDSLALQLKQVKDELVDAKAELERSKSSAASLTKEKTDLTAKNEECSTNLRSNTLKLESLQVEKQALESTKQSFEKENTDLKGNLTEFERNVTSLKQLIDSQKAVIDQQNQTMKLMQSELDTLKGQKGNVQATTAPGKKPEEEKKPDEKKEESKTPEEQKSDQDKEKKVDKKETDLGPEQLVDLPVKEEEAKNEENKDAAKDPAKEQAVVAQPPVDNANGEPVQQAQNQQAINDAIIGNQNDGAGDGVQDANANGEKLQNGPVHVQPVPPLNNQDNKKVVGGDYVETDRQL